MRSFPVLSRIGLLGVCGVLDLCSIDDRNVTLKVVLRFLGVGVIEIGA